MPVGVIIDFAGGDAAAYDRVMERMALGGRTPEGCRFHAAGPHDGGWRVVDVWDDAAAFEAFARSQIGPHAGAEGFPAPSVEMFEVADSFDQRADGDITFLQVVRLDVDRDTFADGDGEIRADGNPAECRFHVNGPAGSGQIVADAWSSREARDAFLEARIMPAMHSRGIRPTAIEDLEVHNVLAPA